MAAKKHILISPWSADVIEKFTSKMADLDVKKKTIGIPNDWQVDTKLLQAMVKARLAENGVASVLTSVDKVLKDLAEDEPVKPVLAN